MLAVAASRLSAFEALPGMGDASEGAASGWGSSAAQNKGPEPSLFDLMSGGNGFGSASGARGAADGGGGHDDDDDPAIAGLLNPWEAASAVNPWEVQQPVPSRGGGGGGGGGGGAFTAGGIVVSKPALEVGGGKMAKPS
jgi:hypothetical protein